MDRTELRKKLEEHLSFLQKTAENAAGLDHYGEAAELSKQILETVQLLDDESAPRDLPAERNEKRAWKTPRLTIDECGFWLDDVHLPMVTRFSLKNSDARDGCFTLDIELEVTL